MMISRYFTPFSVHVVSVISGKSVLRGGCASLPIPVDNRWDVRVVRKLSSRERVIAAETWLDEPCNFGVTIMGWNANGPRVVRGHFAHLSWSIVLG